MDTYSCNSCAAVYQPTQAIAGDYRHTCPRYIGESGSTFDKDGNLVEPKELHPVKNPRNENYVRGLIVRGGKYFIGATDPLDSQRYVETEIASPIVSEGEGRTLLNK